MALEDAQLWRFRTQARRELADGNGLYLVIQPSGVKSWAFRYRSPIDGRTRKLTLGRFPLFPGGVGLTSQSAREIANGLYRELKAGREPSI